MLVHNGDTSEFPNSGSRYICLHPVINHSTSALLFSSSVFKQRAHICMQSLYVSLMVLVILVSILLSEIFFILIDVLLYVYYARDVHFQCRQYKQSKLSALL